MINHEICLVHSEDIKDFSSLQFECIFMKIIVALFKIAVYENIKHLYVTIKNIFHYLLFDKKFILKVFCLSIVIYL